MRSEMEQANQITFQTRLRELRTERRLSQQAVANKTEIARETLCRLENGKQMPDRHSLRELSKLFRVSEVYLKGESDEKKPSEVFDDLYRDELAEIQKSTMILEYFGEQSSDEEKQSEAFVCLLLSLGYQIGEIQNYEAELQDLQKNVIALIQGRVDMLGILKKLPPHTNTRRKRVKK